MAKTQAKTKSLTSDKILLPKLTEAEIENRKNLVKRIRELCDEQNISMRELERSNGFGNGLVSKWEQSSPSYSSLLRIANFFEVSIYDLLGVEEKNTSQYMVAEEKETYRAKKIKKQVNIDAEIEELINKLDNRLGVVYAKNRRLTKKEMSQIKEQLKHVLKEI